MGEYIERDSAISAAIDATDEWDGGPNRERWAKINAALISIPAADVRPVVRGAWEPSEKYKGYVSCSNCHDCYIEPEWVERMKWRFCPSCGTDMREGE